MGTGQIGRPSFAVSSPHFALHFRFSRPQPFIRPIPVSFSRFVVHLSVLWPFSRKYIDVLVDNAIT